MTMIADEKQLHHKVVSFLRKKYDYSILMILGLGKYQNRKINRICAYKKGYTRAVCDLLLLNCTSKFNEFAIEFKSPIGKYVFANNRKITKEKYIKNKMKYLLSNDYDEIIYEIVKYMEESIVYLKRRENHMKKSI